MNASKQNREQTGSQTSWRLLKHCRGEAAWHMAVDEAMLRTLIIGHNPPTLRLYHWDEYAVSVGRFQSLVRTIRPELMEAAEIPIVRRITGGRGILHGDDLTVSITCLCSDLGVSSDVCVSDMYSVITGMFRQAFATLGIDAEPGPAGRLESQSGNGDCFAVEAQSDLVHRASGVKLVGGALHRVEDAMLFQASIPLHTPTEKATVLEISEHSFQGRMARSDLDMLPISSERLEDVIVDAMTKQVGSQLYLADQTEFEITLTSELSKERYGNTRWTNDARSFVTPFSIDTLSAL